MQSPIVPKITQVVLLANQIRIIMEQYWHTTIPQQMLEGQLI